MRNHFQFSRYRRPSAAFTLVELLIVIVIVAVLATFAFMAAQKSLAKAASVKSLSNIRQSGTLLLGDAMDKNGRLRYFQRGNDPGAVHHYYIVRDQVGKKSTEICEIMHWNVAKLKPSNPHWNCFGVNFSSYPDLGVTWNEEDSPNGNGKLRVLSINSVTRPEAFPFLLDSSNNQGEEIFRIEVSGDELPGLRNSGKAHAFFLDGSARELGPAELQKAGFTKAYDNSNIKSPKLINL